MHTTAPYTRLESACSLPGVITATGAKSHDASCKHESPAGVACICSGQKQRLLLSRLLPAFYRTHGSQSTSGVLMSYKTSWPEIGVRLFVVKPELPTREHREEELQLGQVQLVLYYFSRLIARHAVC